MPSEPPEPRAEGELIDTHCHLAHKRLAGRAEEVLRRAREAGVGTLVLAAGTLADSEASLSLCRDRDDLYCMAGIHPHDAAEAPQDYLGRLQSLAAAAPNVAIGEIGLDYHYDFSPRNVQQRVFAEQLALAARLGKPVVIHVREAFDDTLAMVKNSAVAGEMLLFHSFTGGPDQADRALALGATLSFSGIATFKKAEDVRAAAARTPADRILVETDAPYLSPEPVRKIKTNEPANVVHVARRLAQLRGVDEAQFAAETTANARRFFALPAADA